MASHDDLGHTSENGVDAKSLAAQVKETGYDPDEFIVPVRQQPAECVQLHLACVVAILSASTLLLQAFGSRYLAQPIPKDRCAGLLAFILATGQAHEVGSICKCSFCSRVHCVVVCLPTLSKELAQRSCIYLCLIHKALVLP